jgi:hypothetical protein
MFNMGCFMQKSALLSSVGSFKLNTCLSPSTPILTLDAGYVEAQSIRTGFTLVVSDLHKARASATVQKVQNFFATDFVRINEELEVTRSHPLMRADGVWVEAGSLNEGDYLMGVSRYKQIHSIRRYQKKASTVVDLITDNPFIACGLVSISKFVLRSLNNLNIGGDTVLAKPLLYPRHGAGSSSL